ncbi:rhomboid family intramembrane serine protease [Thioflexithrix psekupsensis]|uniref:Rhomboid family intramembrane serine protease n=1 Tax=Thioflexithrix psekupsensis TaxID=1570016 RepID=A0A251X6Q6_9GAMM|nr:rhomboid family intramembrane serine protease [Thioflexithrix psekupsensis]OUD12933.1 rhomboid family intramembrane serine protease [Thioflexithrix psekupsensis]
MIMHVEPIETAYKYNAVFFLILINLTVFFLDHFLHFDLTFLYLNHGNPQWYQLVTALFCHSGWEHLSGNLFFLYIFGKLIEEEEGELALYSSYLICGLGASIASVIFLETDLHSLGASGAVFGLFTVAVLIKLSWEWRNLLEILILGQFVLLKMLNEAQLLEQADNVNRIAHLGGAIVGVVMMLLLFWFGRR